MNNKTIKLITIITVILADILLSVAQSYTPVSDIEPSISSQASDISSNIVSFVPTTLHSVGDLKDVTLTELRENNSDTVGWMTIGGTKCDDVVVLGEDAVRGANYYLDHSFDHRTTTAGTLYIDSRTTFNSGKFSQNITIYGHHMMDGSKFAQIKKYRDIDFYKEHPYFTFETIYGEYDCQVFALFTVDLTTKEGQNFDYRSPDYSSEEEFLNFISQVKDRSEISCPVRIDGDSKIVTLSTCTYISDDARLVVMAKLVPKGQGGNVDVTQAYKK